MGAVDGSRGRLVFTRFEGNSSEFFNDIYSLDLDGGGEIRLTFNPGPDGVCHDNAAPRFNKERTLIAFVSTRNNPRKQYNIFFLDPAAGKTAQVTFGDLDIRGVDWAPDDSGLVFSGNDENGLQQIYSIKLDGSAFTRLTHGPEENMNPLWSPRGDLIAFTRFSRESETAHVWIMDRAGKNCLQLTTDEAAHANPSWSPDGAWVIFRSDLGGPHLRRINVDTREMFAYQAPPSGVDASPIWAEEGIVFSSNRDWEGAESLFNLYLMSTTGDNLRRLTTGRVFEYCGDCQVLPSPLKDARKD